MVFLGHFDNILPQWLLLTMFYKIHWFILATFFGDVSEENAATRVTS